MSYGMPAQEDDALGCRRTVCHISVCTGKIKIRSVESPISGHEVKSPLGEGLAHTAPESLRPTTGSLPSVCLHPYWPLGPEDPANCRRAAGPSLAQQLHVLKKKVALHPLQHLWSWEKGQPCALCTSAWGKAPALCSWAECT